MKWELHALNKEILNADAHGQIIFVLHQIVDRMDNLLQLRTAYGSGPLEELNVSRHRRLR